MSESKCFVSCLLQRWPRLSSSSERPAHTSRQHVGFSRRRQVTHPCDRHNSASYTASVSFTIRSTVKCSSTRRRPAAPRRWAVSRFRNRERRASAKARGSFGGTNKPVSPWMTNSESTANLGGDDREPRSHIFDDRVCQSFIPRRIDANCCLPENGWHI